MKLAIFLDKKTFLGKLCKFFTGCYAYHTAFVDEELGLIYDRTFLFRRRQWPNSKHKDATIYLFDFPNVTQEFLEHKLTTDADHYDIFAFLLFGVRKFYHLVGKPTRNMNGKICSEEENEYLKECGYETPWSLEEHPPSPCDLLKWAIVNYPKYKVIVPKK